MTKRIFVQYGVKLRVCYQIWLKFAHNKAVDLPRRPRVCGAPWARATKNVKKPVSHVEKFDLRFLQNKTETYLVSVAHLILRFAMVQNKVGN
jgi:hypothetical protein